MRTAVITADIIRSSSFDTSSLQIVLEVVKSELLILEKELGKNQISYDIFRGDSFQVVLLDATKSLQIALRLKTAINKIQFKHTVSKAVKKNVDLRMSIGIGQLDSIKGTVTEMNGEAFRYSGRSLDQHMKSKHIKTILKTANGDVNMEFEVSFKFLDYLIDKWSIASAEVVYYLLQGYIETEIATELSISQAAINLRKKAAGWEEIQSLLQRYKHVITNLK